MTHTTLPSDAPVRIIAVGAGNMGRRWIGILHESPAFELVGIVDIDDAGARRVADGLGRPDLPVARELADLTASVGADAVANVTIPAAHHAVTSEALRAGLAVVSEKPAAATLSESLSLAAAAELSGRLVVVSQSRRHNPRLRAFKEQSAALGRAGVAVTEFFKAPHFGGFRDEMAHPLLLDMAIHPFDSARYLLDAEPLTVYCDEYNPPWSWFRGDAAATAIFEMTGGIRYVYTASWASPGRETSWNGSWRLSAERGTAQWDGESDPDIELIGDSEGVLERVDAAPASAHEGVSASLHAFASALHTGEVVSGEIHENILSLAMVEAAIESAETSRRVRIDDVLDEALRAAIAEERDPAVAEVLGSWDSVGERLRGFAASTSGRATISAVSSV